MTHIEPIKPRKEEIVIEKPVIEQKTPAIQIGGFDLDNISVQSEEDYNCPDQPDSLINQEDPEDVEMQYEEEVLPEPL
jgi:hypothetical protein